MCVCFGFFLHFGSVAEKELKLKKRENGEDAERRGGAWLRINSLSLSRVLAVALLQTLPNVRGVGEEERRGEERGAEERSSF